MLQDEWQVVHNNSKIQSASNLRDLINESLVHKEFFAVFMLTSLFARTFAKTLI